MTTSFTRRRHQPRVSVVLPALNEESSIGWVIDNIPDWVSEVVLVDGLSTDGTELIATDRREDIVLVHQRSRGRGAALRAGFAAASGDIIVTIDADGSTDPREMPRFVDALLDGAEFVKGSRRCGEGGGSLDVTRLRRLGNLALVTAANLMFRLGLSDLTYGYCAFWRKDLDRLAPSADDMTITAELVLSAAKAGLSIREVPSLERERRAGASNLNILRHGARLAATLLRERLHPLGRRDSAAAAIMLVPTLVPAHDSDRWLPAGSDTRTWSEQLTASRLMQVLLAIHPSEHGELRAARLAEAEREPMLDR